MRTCGLNSPAKKKSTETIPQNGDETEPAADSGGNESETSSEFESIRIPGVESEQETERDNGRETDSEAATEQESETESSDEQEPETDTGQEETEAWVLPMPGTNTTPLSMLRCLRGARVIGTARIGTPPVLRGRYTMQLLFTFKRAPEPTLAV